LIVAPAEGGRMRGKAHKWVKPMAVLASVATLGVALALVLETRLQPAELKGLSTACGYCGVLVANGTREGYYLDLWSHLIDSHVDQDGIDGDLADLQAALADLDTLADTG
jgi:hypothetical protein